TIRSGSLNFTPVTVDSTDYGSYSIDENTVPFREAKGFGTQTKPQFADDDIMSRFNSYNDEIKRRNPEVDFGDQPKTKIWISYRPEDASDPKKALTRPQESYRRQVAGNAA